MKFCRNFANFFLENDEICRESRFLHVKKKYLHVLHVTFTCNTCKEFLHVKQAKGNVLEVETRYWGMKTQLKDRREIACYAAVSPAGAVGEIRALCGLELRCF